MKRFLIILLPLVAFMGLAASHAWAVDGDACDDLTASGLTDCEWACRCAVRECEPALPTLRPPTPEEMAHRLEVGRTCRTQCPTRCDGSMSETDRFNCVTQEILTRFDLPHQDAYKVCLMERNVPDASGTVLAPGYPFDPGIIDDGPSVFRPRVPFEPELELPDKPDLEIPDTTDPEDVEEVCPDAPASDAEWLEAVGRYSGANCAEACALHLEVDCCTMPAYRAPEGDFLDEPTPQGACETICEINCEGLSGNELRSCLINHGNLPSNCPLFELDHPTHEIPIPDRDDEEVEEETSDEEEVVSEEPSDEVEEVEIDEEVDGGGISEGACSGWVVESGSVACCLVIYGDVSGDVSQLCANDPCALFFREYGTLPAECLPDVCTTNPEAEECREPAVVPEDIIPTDAEICADAVSLNINPEDREIMDDGSEALFMFGTAELVFDPSTSSVVTAGLSESDQALELVVRQTAGFAPLNAESVDASTSTLLTSGADTSNALFVRSITSANDPVVIPLSFGVPPQDWDDTASRRRGVARQSFEVITSVDGERIRCPIQFDYLFGNEGGGGCSLTQSQDETQGMGFISVLLLVALMPLFILRRRATHAKKAPRKFALTALVLFTVASLSVGCTQSSPDDPGSEGRETERPTVGTPYPEGLPFDDDLEVPDVAPPTPDTETVDDPVVDDSDSGEPVPEEESLADEDTEEELSEGLRPDEGSEDAADVDMESIRRVDPANRATIERSQAITIIFSRPMNPDPRRLRLSGTMNSYSDGGVWTTTTQQNDTLTIRPISDWATGTGTLVIHYEDMQGRSLRFSLVYGIQVIYVSEIWGSGDGTMDNPMGSPREAVEAAGRQVASGAWNEAHVQVQQGSYEVTQGRTINMRDRVSLYGGYCIEGGWTRQVPEFCRSVIAETRCSSLSGRLNPKALVSAGSGVTSESVIDGFHFQMGDCAEAPRGRLLTARGRFSAIRISQGGLTIRNNRIDLARGDSETSETNTYYGIFANNANHLRIVNNEIYCGHGGSNHGISNSNARGLVQIFNNTIACEAAEGRNIGIRNSNTDSIIRNNTIFGGRTAESYGVFNSGTSAPTIENNIIYTAHGVRGIGIYMDGDLTPSSVSNNHIFGDLLYRDAAHELGLTSALALEEVLGEITEGNIGRSLDLAHCFNDEYRYDVRREACQSRSIATFFRGINGAEADWGFSTDKDGRTRTVERSGFRTLSWSMGAYEHDFNLGPVVIDPNIPAAEVSPRNRETILKSQRIIITFTEPMDPDSLRLEGTIGEVLSEGRGNYRWTSDRELTIYPGSGWPLGTQTLTVDARDLDGNALRSALKVTYGVQAIYVTPSVRDDDRDRDNGSIDDPMHDVNAAIAEASGRGWDSAIVLMGEGEYRIADDSDAIQLNRFVLLSGGYCSDSGRWENQFQDICQTTIIDERCTGTDIDAYRALASAPASLIVSLGAIGLGGIEGFTFTRDRETCGSMTGRTAAIRVESGSISIQNNIIDNIIVNKNDSGLGGPSIHNNTITTYGGILNYQARGGSVDGNKINAPFGVVNHESHNIGISNNEFEGTGINATGSESLTISKNKISGGKIDVRSSNRVNIYNNTIHTNDVAINLAWMGAVTIRNNTLFVTESPSPGRNSSTILKNYCSDPFIENNIFHLDSLSDYGRAIFHHYDNRCEGYRHRCDDAHISDFIFWPASLNHNHFFIGNADHYAYESATLMVDCPYRGPVGDHLTTVTHHFRSISEVNSESTLAAGNREGGDLSACLDSDLRLDETRSGCSASEYRSIFQGGLDGSAYSALGFPEPWGYSTDKDGSPRTGNGRTGWSIGAFEYD